MKAVALKWWISLAVIACIGLASGVAFAQNGQGLAAVGAISPANPFPRWYMDRSGLQLGQCLDTTNPADPCVLGIVAGSPAPNVLPNPALPLSFPGNFPTEFFYWRATATITGVGGNNANRALLVLSTQGGFGGPTLTAADGAAAAGVFARWRLRFLPGGLVPGATYTFTGPFGVTSIVADGVGAVNFTADQGCIPTPGAVPPPCNFAAVLPTTNVGPFLVWDPAVAPIATPGFIGDGLIAHSVINSPVAQNFFRVSGPNVGGPGVNVIETNQFVNVIGKIYVRPATVTTLTSTPNPSIVGQAVTLTATVRPAAADALVPGGTVIFRDGATSLGVVTLVNGRATLVTSALAVGTHSLTVAYSGDLEFSASTSAAVTQTVNLASTTTSLTSTPNPSAVGQAVTLRATVSPVAPATGVPTGSVTFRDGATSLGVVALVNGSASLTISTLAAGSHSLTAAYGGSPTFLASTSAVVTQTVNAAAPAPPPAAGTDTVSINRAERAGNQLRVEGTTSRLANGTFAASVEIHDGTIVGGACTGALITTTPVSGGSWAFRGTTPILATSVCVKSAGGRVASRALQLK